MFRAIYEDLKAVPSNSFLAFVSNRGFHALLVYRLSNILVRLRLSFFALLLTRIVQILYSIDISPRAEISGGVLIVHGIGLVVGNGVKIGSGTKIYHGVTLGIADRGVNDGFPIVGANVLIGTGAALLGPICVGDNAIIGANSVVISDVPSYMIASGIPAVVKNRR